MHSLVRSMLVRDAVRSGCDRAWEANDPLQIYYIDTPAIESDLQTRIDVQSDPRGYSLTDFPPVSLVCAIQTDSIDEDLHMVDRRGHGCLEFAASRDPM